MSNKLFWGTAGTVGVLALISGLTGESGAVVQPEAIVVSEETPSGLMMPNETSQKIETSDIEKETVVSPITKLQEIQEEKEVRQSCHPSYSGCLNPDASDYDCASGSGNGPYYTGSVRVIGYDEYDLDRDNDGWGCE